MAPIAVLQDSLRNRRVLVADPSATGRRILATYVHAWGMHAVEAASPEEAVAYLAGSNGSAPLDAALIGLPPAPSAANAIAQRVLQSRSSAAIFLFAPINNVQLKAQTAALANIELLFKPFRPRDLKDKLLDHFGQLAAPAPIAQPPAYDASFAQHFPAQVLVVEDNAVNQKVMLRLLQRLGYEAAVAANGEEAVNQTAAADFTVIFMDVQMPVMDGLEATCRIRAAQGRPQPIIIAMTAAATEEDRSNCLAAGMDEFVTKPASLDRIAGTLERLLGAAQVAAHTRTHFPPSRLV